MVTDTALRTFQVPKLTGTHADVFAAVGLADLLSGLDNGEAITLQDGPTGITVTLPHPVDTDELRRLPADAGYQFLQANEKVRVPPEVGSAYADYKSLKAKADEYRKAYQALQTKGQRTPEALQAVQQLRPGPEWRLWQVLNTLQGDDAANAVLVAILRQSREQAAERLVAELTAAHQGQASGSPLPVSSVQLFSPHAAKGYGRLKPDSTSRNDKTKEQWADPFWEWMKARGYWHAAFPHFQGSKGEHIRLLCPAPADIPIGAYKGLVRELRQSQVFGTGPKLDALAVLELAYLLIEHSQDFPAPDKASIPGLLVRRRRPSELIGGMMITHYQSLGSAKAISAMATLALPGWFPVNTREDADDWRAIIDEHRRILRGLDENHSDEIGLLVQYRRFLEQRGEPALMALLDFVGQYGAFWMRVFGGAERRRPRWFTETLLRRIVEGMAEQMVAILDDPGFRAVATAVRRATVNAQAQKAMGQRQIREIRYDLLPELRRKRSLPKPDEFMEAVAEFISLYNVENARRREMSLRAPGNVTTDEFVSFTRLVETHGQGLVGALLCAFGSCREPRESGPDASAGDGDDTNQPETTDLEGETGAA